jgi:hypothetical protein
MCDAPFPRAAVLAAVIPSRPGLADWRPVKSSPHPVRTIGTVRYGEPGLSSHHSCRTCVAKTQPENP